MKRPSTLRRHLLLLLITIVQMTSWQAITCDGAPPNVIFIMADDLGYGDLGCYGQTKIKTPRIDELAREGMRFTQFYAGSTVCAPSRCVLMTGLHTGHCFIRGNGKDNLRPEDGTLAEVMKSQGYRTGMIGKWGLGHEGSSGLPTRQGFDFFFGYLDQHHAHNYYPTFLVRNDTRVSLNNVVPNEGRWGQGVASKKRDYSHDLMMDEAIKFVQEADEAPFFLYLPFTIPHANNEAGSNGMEIPAVGEYGSKPWPEAQQRHAAMIAKLDYDVGRLLDLLDAKNLSDNTVVFFTSDNGPHREGGNNPEFANSNGPLTGIKRSLHEGGIRVPMIVRWPGNVAQNTTNDWVGSFQDVMPTLAEIAETEAPAGIDGISFVPTLKGDKQSNHAYLYWAFYERGGARAIRVDDWKAIQQPYNSPVRLYRLDQDLGETLDVANTEAERVAELTRIMDAAYKPSDRWRFPKAKDKK